MTNRPNRGWRIRGNTARAMIHRSQQPLEITKVYPRRRRGNLVIQLAIFYNQATKAFGGQKCLDNQETTITMSTR